MKTIWMNGLGDSRLGQIHDFSGLVAKAMQQKSDADAAAAAAQQAQVQAQTAEAANAASKAAGAAAEAQAAAAQAVEAAKRADPDIQAYLNASKKATAQSVAFAQHATSTSVPPAAGTGVSSTTLLIGGGVLAVGGLILYSVFN